MPVFRKKLCLFGASPGTGNQGVNALCWSTLEGVADRVDADMHVYRYGAGRCRGVVPGTSPPLHFTYESMSAGRRIWRANHLLRARYAAYARSSGNAIVRAVRSADAVLDVSGGDSFTDLYGASRFSDITGPKKLALTLGTPLVLLPQTYGPFASHRNEQIARDLIANSALAYARDPDSYERLRLILGHRFDKERHRLGVDLAFGLRARQPEGLEPALWRAVYERGDRPLIGLNVSGLLSNQPATAGDRFALVGDYRQLIVTLVTRLLDSTDAHILLVPHVHAPAGHYESDLDACRALLQTLPERCQPEAHERLTLVTTPYDASELKWLIGQTEWFCGTRMHSTIAALSSGVPACALAYSLKARGVFASCGVGDAVVDLRHLSADAAVEHAFSTWKNRSLLHDAINDVLPRVRDLWHRQLDDVVSTVHLDKAA
jgi:polysaccharide pyruvyl transferase WcaK-like protein